MGIENLRSSSREILGRHSWWQHSAFRQLQCGHNIILTERLWFFDDLFSIWNVCNASHLLVWSTKYILYSKYVLAALPHLQPFVELYHSVQFYFLHHTVYIKVVFSIHWIRSWQTTCLYPVIGWSKPRYNDVYAKGPGCGFWLLWASTILCRNYRGLNSDIGWYDGTYIGCHISEISILWVCFLLWMSQVLEIWYLICIPDLHRVGVAII